MSLLQRILNEIYNGRITKSDYCINNNFKVNIYTIWEELETMEIPTEILPPFNFNVELCAGALPLKYLIGYLFTNLLKIDAKRNNLYLLYDIRSKIDYETIEIIKHIKLALCKNDVYYLQIELPTLSKMKYNTPSYTFSFPWNDYIIPTLAALYPKNKKGVGLIDKVIKIDDHVDYDMLREKIRLIMNQDNEFYNHLLYVKNNTIFNNFIENTYNVAVCVNGTACVGKSSLLNEISIQIKETIDNNSIILKVGKYGGFKGKDINQVLAMTYQLVGTDLLMRHPTSLMDRCPFNNLIWRFILQCMKYKIGSDNIDEMTKIVHESLPMNLIKIMQSFPVIVLIDLNILKNRERMFNRSTGGDGYRCYINSYVHLQNVFYTLFADLANWPIFNTAFNQCLDYPKESPNKRKTIKQLILKKLQNNAKAVTVNENVPILERNVFFKSEYEENFDIAKKFNILK
ncbi:p-loop NTPase/TK1 [Macrobrachium rosenbergii nudivirus]|nr:p-loop NTPase/TK1 [Macrobrachium rosenbergii nudivirus]